LKNNLTMGLITRDSKKRVYCTLRSIDMGSHFDSCVVQEWSEKTLPRNIDKDNLLTRQNSKGRTVYYKRFDALFGMVENMFIRDHDYGQDITIDFTDDKENYRLQFNVKNNYGKDFMMKVKNIDLSLPLYIKPYDFVPEDNPGRRIVGVGLKQGGEKVGKYYTKDEPNGLPEATPREVRGKLKWDTAFIEQDEFLLEQFEKFCKENFSDNNNSPVAESAPAPVAAGDDNSDSYDDNDLPF